VDQYITNLLVPPDPVLNAALESSHNAGLPAISVSPAQGKLLYLLAKMRGASRILEIGTLGGYSAIWLARALPPGGRLITLESDSKHAEVAKQNLGLASLADKLEVRLGPALETLPQIEAEGLGPFDFVFIDADKPSYPEYFKWALKLTRAGSVIIVDNVVRKGKVVNAATDDEKVQGVQRCLELAASTPGISGTAIQTVGVKGYDGFALFLVGG
jgi:predicted O-methyltransferase YrrM